ncbi:hypothetical protein N5C79_20145 [Pantoea brenneri]|nr:hypothetical protein [Pantoea brenneri]MDH1088816.1 hypothetical protein [Pantoea brenneri]
MNTGQKQALIEYCERVLHGSNNNSPMEQVYKIALAALTAEPVADVVSWNHPVENRTCAVQLRRFDLLPGELFTAPPAPAADLAELLPDGWKVVPVEPTRQMMAQGHFALGGTDRGKFRRIYQAMLAAAPDAESENNHIGKCT